MDSSDFLRQILFQPYLVKKTPYVRRTSPGTRMFLLTIYLPWLLNMLPYSYWALTCLAVLPTYSAFMVSVRQASDLPPASFRFPVTQDTLALGYILPAVGRIRDFHPLKHAPAGRTKMWSALCMTQSTDHIIGILLFTGFPCRRGCPPPWGRESCGR